VKRPTYDQAMKATGVMLGLALAVEGFLTFPRDETLATTTILLGCVIIDRWVSW